MLTLAVSYPVAQRAPQATTEAVMKTLGIAIGALALGATAASAEVLELRQYRMTPNGRDGFVALFDREFVETQEAVGMTLLGQFRDLDDPNRFTWIRAFPDMAAREQALTAFYSGDHWKAKRSAANAFILDSDNVLLLKPAGEGRGFAPVRRDAAKPGGVVVANLWRLWAEPDAEFVAFFEATVKPELEAAGLPVTATFLPVREPNSFPRLPMREGEKLFVWFTRADSAGAYAAAVKRLEARPGWKARVAPALAEQLESPPLVRRLAPTPRSALR
jgi:quinol monooxygenase YgiN